ncbi:MAG: hypothetical protein KAY24_15805, partial [Candidatus Eisenbacteria sp.]|nr:hypothetical protein [Candidatus Eisenbacteria bacterium]
ASNASLTDCIFWRNKALLGGGMSLVGGIATTPYSSVIRCTFSEDSASYGGGIAWTDGGDFGLSIVNCTIADNEAESGGGLWMGEGCAPSIDRTIVAFSTNGGAVRCNDPVGPSLSCCDVYDNTGGDWDDCISGQGDINNNFSEDPMFCGGEDITRRYTLHWESPCGEQNNPQCGQIGAWGYGCPAAVGKEDEAEQFGLIACWPNPATSATRAVCSLPPKFDGCSVSLELFDVTGRLIRCLVRGTWPAGEHHVDWDGLDAYGSPAPGGVYFWLLHIGGTQVKRQVVLLR